MSVIPMCADCRLPRCKCHDRRYWERGAEQDAPNPEPAPDERVMLGRVAPPVPDGGLLIEGIGTTRGWDCMRPLAVGLTTLSGATEVAGIGRQPRLMKVKLPVPLLWGHDWELHLGTMHEATATMDALYFRATIVPPGTPGYDPDLLRRVWGEVRDGEAAGVSFAAAKVRRDGSWEPSELSVCPQGANPFAIITRATFPDGHMVQRAEPAIDLETTKAATIRHRTYWQRRQKAEAHHDDELPYAGVWADGKHYRRGQFCTFKGTLWHCDGDAEPGERPGKGPPWRLMLKTTNAG
jgi:hypothetical protein